MKIICVCLLGFLLSMFPYATYAAVHTPSKVEVGVSPQALHGIMELAMLALQHPELATQTAGGCTVACDPGSSDSVRGIYLPITQQSLVSLAMLASQNSSLSAQLAGDCQQTCDYDPDLDETTCTEHCDPSGSQPVHHGPPPSAGDLILMVVLIVVVLLVVNYALATPTGPPPS